MFDGNSMINSELVVKVCIPVQFGLNTKLRSAVFFPTCTKASYCKLWHTGAEQLMQHQNLYLAKCNDPVVGLLLKMCDSIPVQKYSPA